MTLTVERKPARRASLPGTWPTFGVTVQPIYWVLIGVFVIGWVAVSLRGGQFLTVTNITNMFVRSISLGLVSIGQTLVILGGSLDLSVAYMISVAAVVSSVVMQGQPDRMLLGIGAALFVGLIVGLANGLIITRLKVNAFIATLGTALIMRGLLNASFENFSGAVPPEFQALGYDSVGPVPWSILLLLGLAGTAWAVVRYTRFGYHLYAVGGNEEVARLSGVRSGGVLILAHVLCSLTAVLTALFIVSRLRAGAPWVGPDGGYDLESIAAVVLGGTALAGGRGSVLGTLAGVLIFAIIDNVFNEFQVDPFLKTLLRGVIIVGAVASYSLRSREARELA